MNCSCQIQGARLWPSGFYLPNCSWASSHGVIIRKWGVKEKNTHTTKSALISAPLHLPPLTLHASLMYRCHRKETSHLVWMQGKRYACTVHLISREASVSRKHFPPRHSESKHKNTLHLSFAFSLSSDKSTLGTWGLAKKLDCIQLNLQRKKYLYNITEAHLLEESALHQGVEHRHSRQDGWISVNYKVRTTVDTWMAGLWRKIQNKSTR